MMPPLPPLGQDRELPSSLKLQTGFQVSTNVYSRPKNSQQGHSIARAGNEQERRTDVLQGSSQHAAAKQC